MSLETNKKMASETLAYLEKIVDQGLALGADDVDLIMSSGESFSCSSQQEKIDKCQTSQSKVLGVRVIKDQKIGLSSTESLEEESIAFALKSALDSSKFGEAKDYHCLEPLNLKENLFQHSAPFLQEQPVSFLMDSCIELEKKTKAKDSRIQVVPYNGISFGRGSTAQVNSKGLKSFETDSQFSAYTSVFIEDKSNNKSSMHYHSMQSRDWSKISLDYLIEESYVHASQWLDAMPLQTGLYDVIFTTDALESLMRSFMGIFNGKVTLEGNNPFEKKLGQTIADQRLNLIDAPRYQEAFHQSFFDSEGFTPEDVSLIKDGVFENLLHNSQTAKYFKTSNNARGQRSAKSSLSVSSTNLVIFPGADDVAKCVEQEYFEIHTMQGLHSGMSFTSGDFSFAASGYLVKEGKRQRGVKGVTVAGNFYEMLHKISMMGQTLHSSFGQSFFAPLIRFSDIRIAGN